ncbi:uncharacterized protein EV420DRAFT_1567896, partial [Desarmillaria tabescens]
MTIPSDPYLADKSILSLATEFIDIFRRTSYENALLRQIFNHSDAMSILQIIYGILRFNQYLVDPCELLGTLTPVLLHTNRQYHLTRPRASALAVKTSGFPFRNGKKRGVPGQRLRNENGCFCLCTIILHIKSVRRVLGSTLWSRRQRETMYRYNQLHRRTLNEDAV